MAKGRGMGMGMGNMQQLLAQAQRMQMQMEQKKEELAAMTVTATSGGGMVEATVNGAKKLVALKIDPAAVDPDDVEMLEDLIIAAVGEALAKATEMEEREMTSLAGGMNIPGMR